MQDAASGASFLIGAYANEARAPEDLVAMLWGRLHGDHTTVEINASERSALFENLSPGFGLMSELIGWSIKHNAHWIDMGGLSSFDPAPGDPMRGVIEYKKRFASDFREVAQEWQLEPNPLLAAAANAVRTLARSVSAGRQHLERPW
jgi:lipid II:glycine glycyltransferase (peptidoglycan interpeptide bridge formation enzyme)